MEVLITKICVPFKKSTGRELNDFQPIFQGILVETAELHDFQPYILRALLLVSITMPLKKKAENHEVLPLDSCHIMIIQFVKHYV